MMIKEIIANLAIIISAIYLSSKGYGLPNEKNPSVLIRLLYGLFAASIGVILMNFSIRLLGDVIIDLRTVSIIIVTTFLGGLPGLVASVLIGVARLFISVSQAAQNTAATYFILGIVLYFVDLIIKNKSIQNRLWVIYGIVMSLISVNFYINVIEKNRVFILLLVWVYTAMGTIIAYGFAKEIQKNKNNAQMLEELSKIDHLTNISNRYSFDKIIMDYHEKKEEYILLLLDIDKFKNVNDTFGHDVGDRVLRQVATTLSNTTIQHAIPYRIGGDEFAILIKGSYARQEIADLIKIVKQDILFNEVKVNETESTKIRVSIGSSHTMKNKEFLSIEEMYKEADVNLYEDKHSKILG